MGDFNQLGRLLIGLGAVVLIFGLALVAFARIAPGGRIPGDLTITRGPITCFVPLATSLILSIVLTVLLNLFLRRR